MAIFSINNVSIAGVAACVPVSCESNLEYDWITMDERNLLVKTTGILNRRISNNESLASDLCFLRLKNYLPNPTPTHQKLKY